jgi:hypothetical protein
VDVVGLIARFSTTPGTAGPNRYNVDRRTNGGFTDGVAQLGTLSSFVIYGSAQPISAQDLQRLPELRRNQTAITFFSAVQLLTGDEAGAFQADRVEVDAGVWYEVQQSEMWRQPVGPTYWRCILQRPATPTQTEEQP